MSKINFSDWDDYERTDIPKEQKIPTLPAFVDKIQFNYDRGRVSIYIGETLVFENMDVGSDFQLTLER